MSLYKGWECFCPDPGKVEECTCRVCGETCEVKRNQMGPTSYAESLAGAKHLHDSFVCPNAGKDWHRHVLELKLEQERTHSNNIKRLLEQEIVETLETKSIPK